ncbi:hypothetical protein HUJ05_005858 [Dendroctonus ponderosae]|nr:hypothetical protein HUJ05_005858 [Dendroctonus ponderosae]
MPSLKENIIAEIRDVIDADNKCMRKKAHIRLGVECGLLEANRSHHKTPQVYSSASSSKKRDAPW